MIGNQIVCVGGGLNYVDLDTDSAMTADSDARVATQKAVKAAISGEVSGVQSTDGTVYIPDAVIISGAVSDSSFITLDSSGTKIELTLAAPAPGRVLTITQIDAGTDGHTVTLTAGTFDGTNDVATFNAAGETLVLIGLTATRFAIILNLGSVGLS